MVNMLVAFTFGIVLGALAMFAYLNGIYEKLGGK